MAQAFSDDATSLPRPVRLLTHLALLGLWLWLYRPVFAYLGVIFSREEFRTNQLLLLGVLILIGMQARRAWEQGQRPTIHLDAPPRVYLPGLALALGASVLYLLNERYFNINTISASLFGLGSYALLGLWLSPSRWRQGLPPMLLLIGVLPFGEHLQTFVGYPMRLATAAIVRSGLAAVGAHSVSMDTILVFENGISQVDLPCSGVKSLWTGLLFLIAATWIERRPINLRWLGVAAIFCGLLFAANVARVGVLVTVGQVAGWRLAAEMLHVPLGVLGFTGACAAAVALIRTLVPAPAANVTLASPADTSGADARPAGTHPRPTWLGPVLAAAVLALALAYTPRTPGAQAEAASTLQLPAGLSVEPWPFTPQEIEWITSGGAETAERMRFQWRDLRGVLVMIPSSTWRAHHRPERCFQVQGLTVEESSTRLINPEFPARIVSLGYQGQHNLYSAAYWLQSGDRATDDFSTRIWDDLSPQRQRWVLVTILFDQAYDTSSPEAVALFEALRESVSRSLKGGIQ